MRYYIIFLISCVVIGLWAPAKGRHSRWIALLAGALVIFFLLSPSRM